MSESPATANTFGRAIRACFWILAAAIALALAVDLLRAIWPWLVGGVLVVVVPVVAWRLWLFTQRNTY
ncbi:MAG: hypothetical protein QM774_00180 [Gordonia sp. (in: high G+C Gram-positive bacteria)]|uniref:hypothetical protein n=1 Tax=Gordonia sp. (in: high G+C Gram-positive bacteria) TaxID=84139 RepID=UPI0039E484CA